MDRRRPTDEVARATAILEFAQITTVPANPRASGEVIRMRLLDGIRSVGKYLGVISLRSD